MGGVVRKIVKNPIKAIKNVVSPERQQAQQSTQQAVAEEKKMVKPLTAKRGSSVGEMQSPMAKAAKRRGRRSNVMTGARGVTGTTATTKKTLLGG